MYEEWVLLTRFQELVFTTREYIRIVSEIDIKWLKEIAPHYYNSNDLADEKKMPKIRNWLLFSSSMFVIHGVNPNWAVHSYEIV